MIEIEAEIIPMLVAKMNGCRGQGLTCDEPCLNS